jgi:hypothetical protein
MSTELALQKTHKEIPCRGEKDEKKWEKINLSRRVDKQMRINKNQTLQKLENERNHCYIPFNNTSKS